MNVSYFIVTPGRSHAVPRYTLLANSNISVSSRVLADA
jgi:hypothetical protein